MQFDPNASRGDSRSVSNMPLAKTLVSLRDVDLTLESRAGPVEILKSVSLAIHDGYSSAIIGPSGSGKTSLLMIMAGLEKPTRGSIEVVGHDFAALGEDQLAVVRGNSIGIVFQSFHLVPTMTAEENVALPLEFSGVSDAAERAKSYLNDVGLSHRADHYPSQLSGGEQQRVAIARALVIEPELLLADEPTGNLDSKTGQRIIELLFELQAKRKATLVLVTHDSDLASRCDHVVRMADGRIVESSRVAAA